MPIPYRRTLTGAWIETRVTGHFACLVRVAPSRVRGLKPLRPVTNNDPNKSHPHGCVD